MAEFTFPCSACGEYIQYDDEWAGYEIQCPTCQNSIVVPTPDEAAAAGEGAGCPGCGADMAADAVVCMACGYNCETGETLATSATKKKKKKKKSGGGGDGEGIGALLISPNGVATICAVLFGILFFLSRSNNTVAIVFLGLVAIYSIVVWVLLVVAGFKTDVLSGVLNLLCCWPYQIYFTFWKTENPWLRSLVTVQILLNIAFRFLEIDGFLDDPGFSDDDYNFEDFEEEGEDENMDEDEGMEPGN